MQSARRTWAVSLAIVLFLFFLRLMTQSSSRPKTASATVPLQPTNMISEPVDEAVAEPSAVEARKTRPSQGRPNSVRRVATALALAVSLVPAGGLVIASGAIADSTHNSGDKVDADTVRLNWTGNGSDADFTKCNDNADPGHLGFENGATADNYMLWIFNTDGGGTIGAVTITVDGTTYSGANDGHQIVTPYHDPASILDAHTNFVVDSTGNGAWVLTISHGCASTVEDQVIQPTGEILGPCADPAYYAKYDNSLSTVAIQFRMRWYTTKGLNVAYKTVPAGQIWLTYQHWSKPGTLVRIAYKDPNTNLWVQLDSELAIKGRYPACDYTPGWVAN